MRSTLWGPWRHISLLFAAVAVLSLFTGSALTAPTAPQFVSNLPGTWSGTFFSKHSNMAPFTITIAVSTTPQGHLVANSTLNSQCLSSAEMQVTTNGSTVVFAGSDSEGDSLTLRGSLDSSGALLQTNYILNGSPSGRCETDQGTGSLVKR
jgi:hypothetical protein